MRISDWSSDVCSADLHRAPQPELRDPVLRDAWRKPRHRADRGSVVDHHLADRPCGATGASLCRQAFGPPDRQLDGRSMNETIVKFGHPATLIAEYEHWVVLLRPAQPTLGALILAAKSDATDFGDQIGRSTRLNSRH